MQLLNRLVCISGCAILLAACADNSTRISGMIDDLRVLALADVAKYATSVKAALVNETPQQVMEKGKKAIADSLKDPSSAQFRNVRLVEYLDGAVICGEVNGKNSYGAYVGFNDFVSGINSGTMRNTKTEPEYANIKPAANAGIDRACSGKSYLPK